MLPLTITFTAHGSKSRQAFGLVTKVGFDQLFGLVRQELDPLEHPQLELEVRGQINVVAVPTMPLGF